MERKDLLIQCTYEVARIKDGARFRWGFAILPYAVFALAFVIALIKSRGAGYDVVHFHITAFILLSLLWAGVLSMVVGYGILSTIGQLTSRRSAAAELNQGPPLPTVSWVYFEWMVGLLFLFLAAWMGVALFPELASPLGR